MLRLILGRASSGKTTALRKIIAEKSGLGKSVVLMVPEQFSFESERAVTELLGAQKASEVLICSFTSLAKRILDEFSPDRKPAVTDAVKEVIMSLTLEALSEKLEVFSDCAKSRKSVSELLHIINEMIQCDISSRDMLLAAEKSGNDILVNKAMELELISGLYTTLLTKSFSDDRYMINAASEIIAREKLFSGRTVLFDEFSGFTAQENIMLSEILTQAEDVYVTCCADSMTDLSSGTGAFSHSVVNIRKLTALANKHGVRVAEPVILSNEGRYHSDAIACLEKGIYEPLPDVYEGSCDSITVASAKNMYDECEFVAMSAKRLVRQEKLRYRDIVIVSRGEEYGKYIPYALKKYGIPVFEDNRRSLDGEIIVIFLLCALTLVAEGFTTDCIMRYLKTYISGIDEDDILLLENYVYTWQIDYSAWLRDWTGHPDGMGMKPDEDSAERLAYINEIRKKVIFPIVNLKRKMTDASAEECTRALYEFLIETKADSNLLEFALETDEATAYQCERAWDELMNVLSLFSETLGSRGITPKRYLELFRIMTASSDMGDIPTGLDEITVGDADRIRVANKKVLFVVGANEGVFPSMNVQSFVITENERRILKKHDIELGTDNTDAARKERLRVYTTLSIPSERLFVSYSTGNLKGEEMLPSEIVAMINHIVPGHTKTDVSFLSPVERIESVQTAFESAAMHYSENSVFASSVKECVSEIDECRDKLSAVKRAVMRDKISIEDRETAISLFGSDMYISPSRVEEYYKCPFKYFCRYGLRAAPREKASFDPRQTGLMVHYVLEQLFGEYGSGGLCAMSVMERRNAVEEYAEKYISTHIGDTDTVNERVMYSLYRCRLNICEIIERLVHEFTLSRFETRDVELRIASDGDVPAYRIPTQDGSVMLMGVVDRVDTMHSEESGKTYLRVVDYKSGGKDFNPSDIMSGLNIQMLVYLICLLENGKERYGDFLPAGVLYVPAKSGKNELGRDASSDETAALRIKQGRMKGMVLAEPEVIRGMDEDGKGLLIETTCSEDGVIKGKAFSLAQFRLLKEKVDDIVRNMASSLHSGRVEAVPVRDGAYKNTCDYCDYKTVCLHDDNDECRNVFKGDLWEALEGEKDE